MSNSSNRLTILSEAEIKSIFGKPYFSESEKEHYFSLLPSEQTVMASLQTSSAAYFILMNGYFKAKHQLYDLHYEDIEDDLKYIAQRYFNIDEIHLLSRPSDRTLVRIKKMILKTHKYHEVSKSDNVKLTRQISSIVRQYNKPQIIFHELLKYIERQQWILPSYSVMQDLIGQAISAEMERLSKMMKRLLPKKVIVQLDDLLATEDSLYGITELKQDVKNFNYTQMKQEIIKRNRCAQIYRFAQKTLPKMKISQGNIAYYASLAYYYSVYKLKRMPRERTYLYLLCYVYHRTQKLNNNLVQSFIYQVSKLYEDGISYGNKEFMAAQVRITYEKEKLGEILGYFCDRQMLKYKFSTVANKAYKIMPKETLAKVSDYLMNDTKKEMAYRWDYFDVINRTVTSNIKPLFMAIDFGCDEKENAVIKSAVILKQFLESNKPLSKLDTKQFPPSLIPKNLKKHLNFDGTASPYKYAFVIYYRLMRYLNNNKVYFNDSVNYKSFIEDIKITENWDAEHPKLLKRLSLPKLSQSMSKRLDELEKELEQAYVDVNARIASGDNDDITLKPDGKAWALKYPKSGDGVFDHKFYRDLTRLNISDVFDFVDSQCHFMNAFEHRLPRYNKKKDHYQYTKACVIANATRQGIYKMARCSNLSYEVLRQTEKDRLRLETLKSACDRISQSIEKLELFHQRNIAESGYYGTIDGSKHITKRETLKSRYSKKYFGLEQGIVSLNMVVNEVPVNCEILSANEYEGHYLYDLYHSNTSGIDPSIISTDTAGSNLVNFSILDNIDVTYAPAYKSVFNRAGGLCGFKSIESYEGMIIQPSKIVPRDLIIEQEPELKKIFAALYLNETSQHVVVQKICCRERQTLVKKALWAYNDIFFSLHLLKYIDCKSYKRVIRKALNRGELYNKLFNAVAMVGGKKFKGLTELEIQIWDHCTRLITLVILYYNMYLLSSVIVQRQLVGDLAAVEKIARVSPSAIQHLNLDGEYHYANEPKSIDIASLVSEIQGLLDKMP